MHRSGGKPSAEISGEAARRYYQRCVPVTDVGPGKDEMTKVIGACTALINSKGGSDENRALAHLRRGSMYRRLGKFAADRARESCGEARPRHCAYVF